MTSKGASAGGQSNPWLIAPVVALAAFMEVLDISVANVALPHIAGDLSASQDESTWTLTSYLVTNAIVMPISGWLSDRFGRKRFFLSCIIGFTISSLLCGLAPSLGVLVTLRALQGAAGGGLQPSGQAILNDAFPPEQRGMATAVYAMAVVFAPAIGPSIGGWLTDNYEWRWVFLINVPVGIALIYLIAFLVHTPNEEAKTDVSDRSDWVGLGLIAISLGCLQIVLDRGQEDDWFASGQILALTIASAIGFVLLVWWELQHPHPVVDLRLLKRRDFGVGFVLMLCFGFVLLGSTYLLPAFAQSLMGYRATEAGEIIMPGGLLLLLLFPLIGRIVNKVDLRLMIGFGILLCGSAIWWMTNWYLDVPFWVLALGRTWQAAGLAFLFLPLNSLAFRDVPKDRSNYASALINLARNFGGSVGISVASTIVTRRQQFHQNRLVEHLQPLDPSYNAFIAKLDHVLGNVGAGQETLARAFQFTSRQIMLLSYLDAFKFLALAFLALLPLLLFARAGAASGGAGAHG
ncbi:MAG: DHA2 family efflux MFS transporter permease subunit [Steroidobacteraceae bacterium]